MAFFVKVLAAAGLVIGMTACTGTGAKDQASVDELLRRADETSAIVARQSGVAGRALVVSVLLDGQRVASLGNGEVTTFRSTPGEHTLAVNVDGVSFGSRRAPIIYDNDRTNPQYFIISANENGVGLMITEVTSSAFFQAIQ